MPHSYIVPEVMLLPQKAKQSSILDFFKRKNGSVHTSTSAADDTPKPDTCSKATTNGISNGNGTSCKRALEAEDSNSVVQNESLTIEVNFISEDLLDMAIDYQTDDPIPEEDKSINPSENYIFSTFRSIIRSILSDEHYSYLFSEQDWSVIHDFTCLPGQIQHLYIKLFMRKRAWIPVSAIKYPEIDQNCNHKSDLNTLENNGFLINSSNFESIEESLNLMSLPELKSFLKGYPGFKFAGSKTKTIPLFLNYIKTSRVLCSQSSKSMEEMAFERVKKWFLNKCYKVNMEKSKIFYRIFLLYYPPDYLLERIGKQNDFQWIFGEYNIASDSYPVQRTNKKEIVYSSRDEFIEFANAFEMVSEIIIKFNEKSFADIVENYLPNARTAFCQCYQKWHDKDSKLELFLRKFSPAGMYLRAIHECLSALERLRKYQDYIDIVLNQLLTQTIYGVGYRGRWYARTALICQTHLKNSEMAVAVCRTGLDDFYIRSGNRLELFTRFLKMVKIEKTDIAQYEKICPDYYNLHYNENTIYAEYRNIENDSSFKNFFSVTLANGEVSFMSVENIVINHYLKKGYSKGIHCENSIYHTILGLFFWDLIYSPELEDSFRYHKQTLPLDLNYDSFYERRKNEIDARIQQISNFSESDLISEITFCWHQFLGKTTFLINWETISLEDILEIAACLTADKIAIICHFLINDFKHLHKGFPDLIVWNRDKKLIKLIEVKSHHDHLSPTQSIWLSYLHSFGIEVELCHVKPQKKS